MYEKENDQLGKNSWLIKRCGEKCIQSIKKMDNTGHHTISITW
jgi:hypothetical protein